MIGPCVASGFFFFNDTATTEIYTLSLHDALPISPRARTLADGGVVTLRAVLFDVDFTLARPGPELGPEGYRRVGERHRLELDPARYDDARAAARDRLQRHPELRHDEEIWVAFTADILRGMGEIGRA